MLGILVEIIVRIKLKEQPLLASKVMNTIMDVFNIEIIYICIGFMVSAEIIKRLVSKFSKLGLELRGTLWEPRAASRSLAQPWGN